MGGDSVDATPVISPTLRSPLLSDAQQLCARTGGDFIGSAVALLPVPDARTLSTHQLLKPWNVSSTALADSRGPTP